jgi:cation diffusion facilitator CzcD-associated flavoprotein CzcO
LSSSRRPHSSLRSRRGTRISKRHASPRIAIVGAGLSGIITAVKFHLGGFENLTVFEASGGPGGTWWDNTYPGAEVDTPSIAYSFSFMPYDWSRTHCRQPELQRYTEDTIDHFGLRSHFRFNSPVTSAVWNETTCSYRVTLANGEESNFDILVAATGLFSMPNIPDWPGREQFAGRIFHSARWDSSEDLTNKRVGVVGTGCTAAQLTPELAKIASQLVVFQREAGWVLPKGDRDFTSEERAWRMDHPWKAKYERLRIFQKTSAAYTGFSPGSKLHTELTQTSLALIEKSIKDPELRELVTPKYPYGCKRPVKDSNFYRALDLPNVELVPRAVASLTATGVVDSAGVEHPLDVVVLATGFQTTNYVGRMEVSGVSGVSLREHWAGDPKAYLGITVSEFPNFFLVYGPNTNGGTTITAQAERQAEFIVRAVKRMRRRGFRRIDTRQDTVDSFARWVDAALEKTRPAQISGCHNYYFSERGRNVTQWPLSHLKYALMTWRGQSALDMSK